VSGERKERTEWRGEAAPVEEGRLDLADAADDVAVDRRIDGATCPSDDASTYRKKQKAYRLLLEKGLIRIGLTIPSDGLEFQIIGVDDPYGCNTNPTTGARCPFSECNQSFQSGERSRSRTLGGSSISSTTAFGPSAIS
jgi:hypothetical protein